MKNLIIAIDGIDGVGKSTLIEKLKDALTEKGHDVVIYSNPGGGTEASAEFRKTAFSHDLGFGVDLLAMGACQLELWNKIKEDKEKGKTVIVDRWTLSTIAYQGGVSGISETTLNCYFTMLNNLRKEARLPDVDLHVWLHADYDLIVNRLNTRLGKDIDKYESKSLQWFLNVQGAYQRVYDAIKLEKKKRLSRLTYWGEPYGIRYLSDIKVTEETTPESNLKQVLEDIELTC